MMNKCCNNCIHIIGKLKQVPFVGQPVEASVTVYPSTAACTTTEVVYCRLNPTHIKVDKDHYCFQHVPTNTLNEEYL